MPQCLLNHLESLETVPILGNLILPHPRDHFLQEQGWVQRICDLLPHIHQLHARDLRSLQPRLTDLPESFKRFGREETRAWATSGTTPEFRSCLTSPSGSLDAPLAHHLHQPSFATSTPASREVADRANPCIAMVMANAFREGETLIYDHLHRRSKRSDGLRSYPENVLHVHEQFTCQIMESSAAKVEVIYGKPVQQRLLRMMKTTTIPLWGRFQGVFLILLHEDNFQNQDSRFMFRKVLLFAAHPQRMFYQRLGSALNQDRTLEAAVLMADPSIKFSPTYFQSRAWEPVVSASFRARHLGDPALREILYSLQEPMNDRLQSRDTQTLRSSKPIAAHTSWITFLDCKPSSNETTRALLPAAIDTIQVETKEEWNHPSELPTAVAAWLQGQGQALFYGRNIRSAGDIVLVVKNSYSHLGNLGARVHSDHAPCLSTLKGSLRQLMLAQKEHLNRIKRYKHDHLVFSRLGENPIEVSCPCGSIKTVDANPTFSCARPSAYVARERMCKSPECNPKSVRQGTKTILRPVSGELDFVRATIPTLQAEVSPRVVGEIFLSLLRGPAETPCRPEVVESWCIVCKDLTETTTGLSVHIDSCARWTIGQIRPLYVERTPRCLRCERTTGQAGRKFIPLDSNIPSIGPGRLARFQQTYQYYDPLMQALLLDSYLPSAREAEYQFEREDGSCDIERAHDGSRVWEQGSVSTIASKISPSTSGNLLGPLKPTISHSDVAAQQDLLTSSNSGEPKMLRPLRVPNDARLFLNLIRDKADCTHLPTQVKIWCKNCKEKTKTASTSTYKTVGPHLIDTNPRWTVGKLPVYLLTRPRCQTCSKNRFVPADSSIISMQSNDLRAWADRNTGLPVGEAILKFEKRTESSNKRTTRVNSSA